MHHSALIMHVPMGGCKKRASLVSSRANKLNEKCCIKLGLQQDHDKSTCSTCNKMVTDVCCTGSLYTPVTEKRPTLEPGFGSDVPLVLVETWKRPIVVECCAGPAVTGGASFVLSDSQVPFGRGDERWRVFSGLEGEEEDEDEDEQVEDGVREEDETMLDGSGMFLDASSVATET